MSQILKSGDVKQKPHKHMFNQQSNTHRPWIKPEYKRSFWRLTEKEKTGMWFHETTQRKYSWWRNLWGGLSFREVTLCVYSRWLLLITRGASLTANCMRFPFYCPAQGSRADAHAYVSQCEWIFDVKIPSWLQSTFAISPRPSSYCFQRILASCSPLIQMFPLAFIAISF